MRKFQMAAILCFTAYAMAAGAVSGGGGGVTAVVAVKAAAVMGVAVRATVALALVAPASGLSIGGNCATVAVCSPDAALAGDRGVG
jgi:hypothetical protein